jgi:hypothetical protein
MGDKGGGERTGLFDPDALYSVLIAVRGNPVIIPEPDFDSTVGKIFYLHLRLHGIFHLSRINGASGKRRAGGAQKKGAGLKPAPEVRITRII